MKVIFTKKAEEDKAYWQKHDINILEKIDKLLADIILHPYIHPYKGIGKPEPLRFQYAGYGSRRITQEHRIVYKVVDKEIYIAQCRYHY